jgi:hypothetical protein
VTQQTLAAALRHPDDVPGLTDQTLITAHITCYCCGRTQVSQRIMRQFIDTAHSAEEFLALCTTYSTLGHGKELHPA